MLQEIMLHAGIPVEALFTWPNPPGRTSMCIAPCCFWHVPQTLKPYRKVSLWSCQRSSSCKNQLFLEETKKLSLWEDLTVSPQTKMIFKDSIKVAKLHHNQNVSLHLLNCCLHLFSVVKRITDASVDKNENLTFGRLGQISLSENWSIGSKSKKVWMLNVQLNVVSAFFFR